MKFIGKTYLKIVLFSGVFFAFGLLCRASSSHANGEIELGQGTGSTGGQALEFDVCLESATWTKPSRQEQVYFIESRNLSRRYGSPPYDEVFNSAVWQSNVLAFTQYPGASGSATYLALSGTWSLPSGLRDQLGDCYVKLLHAELNASEPRFFQLNLFSYSIQEIVWTGSRYVLTVDANRQGFQVIHVPRLDNFPGCNAIDNVLACLPIEVIEVERISQGLRDAREIARRLREDYPRWQDNLDPCPCTARAALETGRFRDATHPLTEQYHPGARFEYRTRGRFVGTYASPTRPGEPTLRPGQQCTYDAEGNLITGGAGAGTPDAYSPEVTLVGQGLVNDNSHTFWDVEPFDEGGVTGMAWQEYQETWTPNNRNACRVNIAP